MKAYTVEYDIEEKVFLKTDPDQLERIVTGIIIKPCGVQYEISIGMDCSCHYGFEMTKDQDIMKLTSN